MKVLLDRGADIEAADVDGETPLHLASLLGRAEVVKVRRHNSSFLVISVCPPRSFLTVARILKPSTNSATLHFIARQNMARSKS